MQIVINIPEDDYHGILQYPELKANTEFENLMIVAIKNGTPLPKGHGRLIDINDLANLYNENDRLWWSNAMDEINEGAVSTIIEADNSEV